MENQILSDSSQCDQQQINLFNHIQTPSESHPIFSHNNLPKENSELLNQNKQTQQKNEKYSPKKTKPINKQYHRKGRRNLNHQSNKKNQKLKRFLQYKKRTNNSPLFAFRLINDGLMQYLNKNNNKTFIILDQIKKELQLQQFKDQEKLQTILDNLVKILKEFIHKQEQKNQNKQSKPKLKQKVINQNQKQRNKNPSKGNLLKFLNPSITQDIIDRLQTTIGKKTNNKGLYQLAHMIFRAKLLAVMNTLVMQKCKQKIQKKRKKFQTLTQEQQDKLLQCFIDIAWFLQLLVKLLQKNSQLQNRNQKLTRFGHFVQQMNSNYQKGIDIIKSANDRLKNWNQQHKKLLNTIKKHVSNEKINQQNQYQFQAKDQKKISLQRLYQKYFNPITKRIWENAWQCKQCWGLSQKYIFQHYRKCPKCDGRKYGQINPLLKKKIKRLKKLRSKGLI